MQIHSGRLLMFKVVSTCTSEFIMYQLVSTLYLVTFCTNSMIWPGSSIHVNAKNIFSLNSNIVHEINCETVKIILLSRSGKT